VDSNGRLEIARELASPTNNQFCVRLTVRQPDAANGLAYGNTHGFPIQTNAWYDLKFCAKAATHENGRDVPLTVSLQSNTGERLCAHTTLLRLVSWSLP
jgi:hypothetical protein